MACIIELCSRILNATKWHMMQFSRRCPVPKGPHPEHHHLRRGACALGTGFFVNASDDSGFQSFCTTTGTQRVTSLTSLGPMSGLCGYRKSKLRHLHRANLIGWTKMWDRNLQTRVGMIHIPKSFFTELLLWWRCKQQALETFAQMFPGDTTNVSKMFFW